MAGIPWDTIISSGASFLGGLLDESDETWLQGQKISSAFGAKYAYPGQKALGGKISSYLWENLNTGLTEGEKRLMRGAGKTSILQGVRSAKAGTSRSAASQGLRGGSIANILANIDKSKISAFGKLETDIQTADINTKRQNIKDILTYLSLSAGYGEDAGSSSGGNSQIASIVNSLYGGGGGSAASGAGPGGGNAPATSSAGFNIGGSTIGQGLSAAGAAIPGAGLVAAILGHFGAFGGEPGNIGDATEGGGVGATGGGGYSGGGYGMGGSEGVGGIW